MSSTAETEPEPSAARAADARLDAAAIPSAGAPGVFLKAAVSQLRVLLSVEACAIELVDLKLAPGVSVVRVPDTASFAPDGDALPAGCRASWSVPLELPDGRLLGRFVAYSAEAGEPDSRATEMARACCAAIAVAFTHLCEQSRIAARFEAVVGALTSALDVRDAYADQHSTETAQLAVRVGRRLGASVDELELVSQVALLHDVGKLGIPTDVLRKPGILDETELALLRQQPVIGERILHGIAGFADVATAIRHEHERWDGLGYPDGLAGDQIPLASRVVFACDAWHAMTSDRPYRPAMTHDEAVCELRDSAGSQFDPQVAQALLELLGEHAAPPARSLSETRDRAVSCELLALAAELGAEDLFVFRKVSGNVYSHLGGVGRGAGWAGNLELDSAEEHHLQAALRTGKPVHVTFAETSRIVGPYYGRSAIVVPGQDRVVVFGSSTDSVKNECTGACFAAAARAHELVVDVSPAKRLADELEVLAAVREITTIVADGTQETLVEIAARARAALSAEFAAVATIPSSDMDATVGISAGDWQPSDPDAAGRALARFGARPAQLPVLCQDVGEMADAPDGFGHADGVSSIHILPIGDPPVAIMTIVHARPGLRGFTALCQRVAKGMSDAAELVVRRALAQARLREENARLTEQVRTDALTGVASRSAWEEAVFAQELHYGRSGAPVSVVIVDVDGLKAVNDEGGHAAGDELLCRCARILADSVRVTDVVARIGGDEFGVLLRYADRDQVEAWCARLDAELLQGDAQRLSWSLGWASVPPHETISAALGEADRRMYEVKLAKRSARS
jgi:diguanylate cyclase (GGDEF)-like protein